MKLIEVSKQGNLYFQMSDGRFGIIYPKSGYVRVSGKGATRSNMHFPFRLWQINKVAKEDYRTKAGVSRVLIPSVKEQFETLLKFDNRNCGGLTI
jgi:hypothetical protein